MHFIRTRGFTLVELMVTVAIVAILATIAFPSFQSTIRSNRTSTATNELIGSISLARTEAIRSTHGAGLCAANAAGNACVDTTDWSNGWLVWTDADATNHDYTAGSDTLVRYAEPKNGIVLTVPTAGTGVLANKIVFDSRGVLANDVTTLRTMTVKPTNCPAGEMTLRTMTLTRVGQADVSQGACP